MSVRIGDLHVIHVFKNTRDLVHWTLCTTSL